MQVKKNPTPLIIMSDAPTSGTGLGRITKDLASRIATQLPDVYRVLTVGYGGIPSPDLPFPQYAIKDLRDDWIFPSLHEIWRNWVGDEEGILLTIWDASRLSWLADPHVFSELTEDLIGLQQWIKKRPFKLWGYLPIDSSGPNDRMTFPLMKTLFGFDRLLAYGEFGEGVIRRTIGDEESDKRHLTNLPHGLNSDVFYPLPRHLCRKLFFQHTGARPLIPMVVPPLKDSETLIGILGTNQRRKNWALGIKTVAQLAKTHSIRLWLHTDILEKEWSIPALLVDYGLIDKTVISLGHVPDDILAEGYSACDLVLGIAPEGFGFVHVEAQACECPVVTGSYAGGAALVQPGMRVDPIAFYDEGEYASNRPVYNPEQWAECARNWIGTRVTMDPQYDWANLWPRWEKYLREAAE